MISNAVGGVPFPNLVASVHLKSSGLNFQKKRGSRVLQNSSTLRPPSDVTRGLKELRYLLYLTPAIRRCKVEKSWGVLKTPSDVTRGV